MGFVPQITCRNCGTKFSALRGRCPKCGTRHVRQTGRTAPAAPSAASAAPGTAEARQRPASGGAGNGSGRWQLIFGAILIVAVIAAVIILIVAGGNQPEETVVAPPSPSIEVTTAPPTPPPPTPTPTPTSTVTSIIITYAGSPLAYDPFTQYLSWGAIQLGATVYPTEALADHTVEWRSSDESVATVDETGLVTPVSIGECEIIAECGGIAAKCGMWVR